MRRATRKINIQIVLLLFAVPLIYLYMYSETDTIFAAVMSSTNYRVQRDSINVGGVRQSSTNYFSEDTIGEIGTGRTTSSSYRLYAGFLVPEEITLTFSVSDTSIGFGTFGSTTIRYATSNGNGDTSEPGSGNPLQVSVITNAPSGVIVSGRSRGDGTGVEGNGSAGFYKSDSPIKLISAVASSAVSTGSEGYGLYVKNVGSNLTAAEVFYDDSISDSAITTSGQTILSSSGPINSNNTADIALRAAIAVTTTASTSYADVLTLVATGKF